jgi:hypothetical protein
MDSFELLYRSVHHNRTLRDQLREDLEKWLSLDKPIKPLERGITCKEDMERLYEL